MPAIGRPAEAPNPLNRVQMAPEQATSNVDAKVLEKITGQKLSARNLKTGDVNTHNKVGKDEFLKMLTHQLQNQDPTNPMEQNKFAADLAQFSQLEQLTNLNKKFDDMAANSVMEKKALAASFIGKQIVTDGASVELAKDGDSAELLFSIEKPSKEAIVRLIDGSGNIAQEVKFESGLPAGSNTVKWDGMALDGYPAPKGTYRLQVQAWDETSQPITVKTQVAGLVESVAFDGVEPVLTVAGKKVYLRDVTSFHHAGTTISQPGAPGKKADLKPAGLSPVHDALESAKMVNKEPVTSDSAKKIKMYEQAGTYE